MKGYEHDEETGDCLFFRCAQRNFRFHPVHVSEQETFFRKEIADKRKFFSDFLKFSKKRKDVNNLLSLKTPKNSGFRRIFSKTSIMA